MSLKKYVKNQLYENFGKNIKHPSLIAESALEKTIRGLAPIAGALTLGSNPDYNIAQKSFAGSYQVGKTISETIIAYARNQGIRDFSGKLGTDLVELAKNAGENIAENPVETIAAATIALATGYAVSGAIKLHKNYRRKKLD